MSKDNVDFDFQKPIQTCLECEEYLHTKQDYALHLKKTSHLSKNLVPLTIVSILSFCLLVLLIYSINQLHLNQQLLRSYSIDKAMVAGINEDRAIINYLSGEGFTLSLKQNIPEGFDKNSDMGEFWFLDNKKAVTTRFVSKNIIQNEEVKVGIEVIVSEYDNSQNKDEFAKKVLDKLGTNFEIKSQDVNLTGDIKATKIEEKNKKDVVYYTTVTSDNYYVIKIYNSNGNYPELKEKIDFTNTFLQSLNLN